MPNLNTFINSFRHGFQQENRFLCQIQTQTIYNTIKNQAVSTSRTGISGLLEDVFSTLLGTGTNDVQFASDMLSRGLMCEITRLPSRVFATTTQTMYGITERFPYQTEYIPIECGFTMPLFGTQNPIINSLENFGVNALLPDNINVTLKNPATNPLPIFFSLWQNLIQNINDGPASGMNFSFPADYYTTMQILMFDRQDNTSLTYMFDKVYPLAVESSVVAWGSQDIARLGVAFAYSDWRIIKTNSSKLNITLNNIPIIGGVTFPF